MAILDDMRLAVRVSSNVYDAELQWLIDRAKADMTRVGIDPDYIATEDGTIKQAIACYVKANFGYDNPDAARFNDSYRECVTDLLHSKHNLCAGGDAS